MFGGWQQLIFSSKFLTSFRIKPLAFGIFK